MSQYTSTTVTVQATPTNAELISQLIARELGAPSTWIPSAQIRSTRLALCSGDDAQVRSALSSPSLTINMVDQQAVRTLRGELAKGPVGASRINSALGSSLVAAERTMERVERRGIAVLAQRALQSINFAVRLGDGHSLSAIEARRGHAVMLMRIDDGGAMAIDWMGHAGNECERDMAEVQEALRTHGVEVAVSRQVRHGSAEGGSLIDQAAASGRGDLVAGVLAQEQPAGAASTASPSRDSSRAQRVRA